jgi:MFS family permease
MKAFHYDDHAIRNITTAVMIGFISGTLLFAMLSIADRYKPSIVFFISCCIAALANVLILLADSYESVLLLRFVTGFFLAGIYPVGMKIAADYYEKGLGKALGYLVGALVLGTAFPHLLKGLSFQLPWRSVMISTSAFAVAGGLSVLLFIPPGPHRKTSQQFRMSQLFSAFSSKNFRAAAFGYFGHMWEVYTFWAFLPLILWKHNPALNISLLTFMFIAIGSIGCVAGGIISQKTGSVKVALFSLISSGICCLLLYIMIRAPLPVFIAFMIFWGITVAGDSPQFSAMVASAAPQEHRGTALTIVTSIGFAITVVSIFLIDQILSINITAVPAIVAVGPALGVAALLSKK